MFVCYSKAQIGWKSKFSVFSTYIIFGKIYVGFLYHASSSFSWYICTVKEAASRHRTAWMSFAVSFPQSRNSDRYNHDFFAFEQDYLFQNACCMCVVQIDESHKRLTFAFTRESGYSLAHASKIAHGCLLAGRSENLSEGKETRTCGGALPYL